MQYVTHRQYSLALKNFFDIIPYIANILLLTGRIVFGFSPVRWCPFQMRYVIECNIDNDTIFPKEKCSIECIKRKVKGFENDTHTHIYTIVVYSIIECNKFICGRVVQFM